MGLRHAIYIAFSFIGLVTCWYWGIVWVQQGGNILNLYSFFRDAYVADPAAAFLTVDLLIVWFAFMIWVVDDARRIGLGARKGWLFFALSFLGTCFAFPLYLVARQRHLESANVKG